MKHHSTIKVALYQYCIKEVDERITRAKTAISAAQSSANEETKSSAGDKYETGRAMMQLEKEKNFQQLEESSKLKKALMLFNPEKINTEGQLGSVVETNRGAFFISISLGQIKIAEGTFMAVAPSTPIGKMFLGKKKGDQVTFNRQDFKIIEVF